jgi:hypothetical protein
VTAHCAQHKQALRTALPNLTIDDRPIISYIYRSMRAVEPKHPLWCSQRQPLGKSSGLSAPAVEKITASSNSA